MIVSLYYVAFMPGITLSYDTLSMDYIHSDYDREEQKNHSRILRSSHAIRHSLADARTVRPCMLYPTTRAAMHIRKGPKGRRPSALPQTSVCPHPASIELRLAVFNGWSGDSAPLAVATSGNAEDIRPRPYLTSAG
jgi:hypothetical protein